MAVLKFNVALIMLLTGGACTAAPPPVNIHIDNDLDKCQHIIQHAIDFTPVPTLKLDYQTRASTAECGCKSMLNSYSVAIKLDGYSRRVLAGSFVFLEKSPITLPLAAQLDLIKDKSLEITIACEAPL